MVSLYTQRRINRIIEFRELHVTVPVPIRQLVQDEGWRLVFRSRMHPLYGFAIAKGPHKVMFVSEDIGHVAQRFVMGHELAHDLGDHVGSFHLCGEWGWANMKQEIVADSIAADLLIPDWAVEEYREIELIAAACEVPEWLVLRKLGES